MPFSNVQYDSYYYRCIDFLERGILLALSRIVKKKKNIFDYFFFFIFSACHQVVDPEPYYRDCLYDVCACQVKLGECLCPMIASYAKECSQKGVLVDWIPEVRECGMLILPPD